MVGQIPPEIGVFKYMTSYISYENALTGPLPTTLGYITPLETLDVSRNQLDGDIPGELFGPNLRVLYLQGNQLSGPIPENYGMASKLKYLWLKNNLLTGTLPIISEGEFLFLGKYVSITRHCCRHFIFIVDLALTLCFPFFLHRGAAHQQQLYYWRS